MYLSSSSILELIYLQSHMGLDFGGLLESSNRSTLIGEVVDYLIPRDMRPGLSTHLVIGYAHAIPHVSHHGGQPAEQRLYMGVVLEGDRLMRLGPILFGHGLSQIYHYTILTIFSLIRGKSSGGYEKLCICLSKFSNGYVYRKFSQPLKNTIVFSLRGCDCTTFQYDCDCTNTFVWSIYIYKKNFALSQFYYLTFVFFNCVSLSINFRLIKDSLLMFLNLNLVIYYFIW